jgi:hypothetical protein
VDIYKNTAVIIARTNLRTGEITEEKVVSAKIQNKFPRKGSIKMYPKNLIGIANNLSPKGIDLFFRMASEVNKYNIFKGSYNKIAKEFETNKAYISKLKRKIIENKYAIEINKKLFLNPFLVLPSAKDVYSEDQFLLQQMWIYIVEDNNKWFYERDDLFEEMFGSTINEANIKG